MNPIQSLHAFILAAATLDSAGTFYAKVDGTYERLKVVSTPDVGLMTLVGSHTNRFPHVPLFTLNNGIATTMNGKPPRVFGRLNNYLAIGSKKYIKPFMLSLDDQSRVLNLQMNLCTSPLGLFPITMNDISNTDAVKCSPLDIYFLTPAEARERRISMEVDLFRDLGGGLYAGGGSEMGEDSEMELEMDSDSEGHTQRDEEIRVQPPK